MATKIVSWRKNSLKELKSLFVREDNAGFHPGLDAVVKIMSKDEIDMLLRVTYKATALYYLDEMRKNSKVCEVDSSLKRMYHFLKKGTFSIKDIRTTDNELKRLIRTGYLSAAKGYLKQSQYERHGMYASMNAEFCLKSLEKAGLSLEALGINKEETIELLELLKKSD